MLTICKTLSWILSAGKKWWGKGVIRKKVFKTFMGEDNEIKVEKILFYFILYWLLSKASSTAVIWGIFFPFLSFSFI
jgi:hypothetical protein